MTTAKDHSRTLAEQTICSFQETLHQSITFQNTATNMLANLVTEVASAAKWPTRIQDIARQIARANQRNTDEAMDYVDRGARSKRELIEKMLTPGGTNPLDSWSIVTNTVCANMESIWRTSGWAAETWLELAWLTNPIFDGENGAEREDQFPARRSNRSSLGDYRQPDTPSDAERSTG